MLLCREVFQTDKDRILNSAAEGELIVMERLIVSPFSFGITLK